MKISRRAALVLPLLLSGVVFGLSNISPYTRAQALPVVSVFNSVYASSNVTDTSLMPGTEIVFDITVSGAPAFNAFEFFLYYDPAYLNATSFDLTTGTVFADGSPANLAPGPFVPRGTVHLAVANFHQPPSFTGSDGVLAHITFKILRVGVSPLVLAPGIPSAGDEGTELLTASTPIRVTTSDGYFKNVSDKSGPVASFTFTPALPHQGEIVTFNATTSFDPDNAAAKAINSYVWQFGASGGSITTSRPTLNEIFNAGNFSIRLTVTDSDDGFEGMVAQVIQVSSQTHDIAVVSLSTIPSYSTHIGDNVTVFTTVADQGTFPESYDLTVAYGSPPTNLSTQTGVFISPGNIQSFSFVLDTSGLTTGPLTLTARADIPIDDSLGNNQASATITLNPPVTNTPPVANFTFSPEHPHTGELVSFSGFSSFDPDGFVQAWSWDFGVGDGSPIEFGPLANHRYSSTGNYTATLTVTDNRGLTASISRVVPVISKPLHDVSIVFLEPQTLQDVSGRPIIVLVGLVNNGLSTETLDLTVYYDSHVAASIRGVDLPAVNGTCPYCSGPQLVRAVWNTTGVPAGIYAISATVPLSEDQNPVDNTFVDGFVIILPAPTITVTPDRGSLGTQVHVHGFNFPPALFGPQEVEITFDDQFVGFVFVTNSSFDFTFNIPHADPTVTHHIHAVEPFSSALDVQAAFTFLPEPSRQAPLIISVSNGPIYFPGETVVVFILATQNGLPVAGADVQVQLFRPNGSSVVLSTSSVSTGRYKATYAVPRTGSGGTYAVVVTASINGQNGAALGGFEVKSPWLSSQSGRTTTAGLALVGIVALVVAATWKGYSGRRREDANAF